MRKDIARFCNSCLITAPVNAAECPKCHTDSNFSYFEGMYYDIFDMYFYSKVNGKVADVQVRYKGQRKDFIEPLLDACDHEGYHEGFIIRRPGGGKVVYMTPLETVRELPPPKSGCLVFFVALSLGGWMLSTMI